MNIFFIILILLSLSGPTYGQTISPGEYDPGLKLTYDSKSKKITGYYENYTGWDEKTKSPRFSCIFYIEGTAVGQKFKIKTYYPADKAGDLIEGVIELVDNKTVKIKLPEEHGGCWNVQHFADEPVQFQFQKSLNWIQIRYVEVAKSYFHSDKSIDKRLKAYIIKGDVFYVEKVEGEWAYGSYLGKKVTKGWMKLADLNML